MSSCEVLSDTSALLEGLVYCLGVLLNIQLTIAKAGLAQHQSHSAAPLGKWHVPAPI